MENLRWVGGREWLEAPHEGSSESLHIFNQVTDVGRGKNQHIVGDSRQGPTKAVVPLSVENRSPEILPLSLQGQLNTTRLFQHVKSQLLIFKKVLS